MIKIVPSSFVLSKYDRGKVENFHVLSVKRCVKKALENPWAIFYWTIAPLILVFLTSQSSRAAEMACTNAFIMKSAIFSKYQCNRHELEILTGLSYTHSNLHNRRCLLTTTLE